MKSDKITGIAYSVVLFLVIFMAGCGFERNNKYDNNPAYSTKDITSFSFLSNNNNALDYNFDGVITGTQITVSLPFGTDVTNIVANFTHTGDKILVDSSVQISNITANNFTDPVTYTVQAVDTTIKDYTISVNCGLVPEIHVMQDEDIFSGTVYNYDTFEKQDSFKTFIIENLGDADLIINDVTLVDGDISWFSINKGEMSTKIRPGNNTTFGIKFMPIENGLKHATVRISNNDSNEGIYIFTLIAYAQKDGALTYGGNFTDATNLYHARATAISPDGKHVYVGSYHANSLAWFTRDVSTGALTLGPSGGVYSGTSVAGATSVAVSPDGKHVYVAALESDAVSWFNRDSTTGTLTLGQSGGMYSSPNIDKPCYVRVSPDGKHVYVAALGTDAVAWFTRDSTTGVLTPGPSGGMYSNTNIDHPCSVEVSPDGKHVYVAAAHADAIVWFTRDGTTGVLTPGPFGGVYSNINIDGAYSVALSPDGRNVYVAAWEADAVAWFTRDNTTGVLTYMDRYSSLNIDSPRCVVVTPDGKNVYVTAAFTYTLAWFTRNNETGVLNYVDQFAYYKKMSDPCTITVSPDGNNIYIPAYTTNAVVWFTRNRGSGALTYMKRFYNGIIHYASSIILSPDNKNVYVSSYDYNSLVWFTRDSTTGALMYTDGNIYTDANMAGAHSAAISPDGKHVYIASETADSVVWLNRDGTTGALTQGSSGGVYSDTNINGASSVAISPDGRNVYVTAYNANAVTWFTRDSTTGALIYEDGDVYSDPINLAGAHSITLSPDGKNVYAVAETGNTVIWFSRDSTSGDLFYESTISDPINLAGARSVAVSPDGKNVYVAAYIANAVAWFTRDSETGDLTYRDSILDDTNLFGASSITISADGNNVYVAAYEANTLVWFTRDCVTGFLSCMGIYADEVIIGGPLSVIVSPDDNNVYVAARDVNAVAWFNREK